MSRRKLFGSILSVACFTLCIAAQQSTSQTISASADSIVPNLINFSGVLTDLDGKPLTGIQGVTFLLYGSQQGGSPLWMETQNITPSENGQYVVTLGITTSHGLPADLFADGQARWLAVQVSGQIEQPRVMLVAVPYALKAQDAQTIGGLPPSAFLLAASANGSAASNSQNSNPATAPTISSSASSDVTTTGGTAGALSVFTTATNVQNSIITQTGTTAINIAGKLNLPASGTATASTGFSSVPLNLAASSFNSSSNSAVAQTFAWETAAVGNDTSTPSGSLNLLFGSGSSSPTQTGFRIANNGQITFATGQTFPGTGTVSTVNSGAGLTGGPITTTGKLSIASAGVTNAMLANPSITITAGTDLTGGGTIALGGTTKLNVDTTKIPQLTGANTFTGNQVVAGSLTASTTNATSALVGNVTSTSGGAAGVLGTTASTNGFGVEGSTTATTGSAIGVYGTSSAPSGYGVGGVSPNIGVYGQGNYGVSGHGSVAGVMGLATASGGVSGLFQGGPVSIAGNALNALAGDPGCGPGFAAIGFTGSSLSNCTNYAVSGGTKGDTYVNSNGSGSIHFRNSNNELAVLNNAGMLTMTANNNLGILQITNTNTSGEGPAIAATSDSTFAAAVVGTSAATTGSIPGVIGQTSSPTGYGVYGVGGIGIWGASTLCTNTSGCEGGYFTGFNAPTGAFQDGGDGIDTFGGTPGQGAFSGNGMSATGGSATQNSSSSGGAGVMATGGIGSQGSDDGIGGVLVGGNGLATNQSDGEGDGVDAYAGSGVAGNFFGSVNVYGTLTASTKDFRIDHPLDPSDKYLIHASVESSEMMNIYTGNITTDAQGVAAVSLPEWFEALNTDFRYQLTVIGQFAQAIISRKIENHQFQIRTSMPNVEVSWQVTAVRQDAYAKAHPLIVEEDKSDHLRGFYIHPELYGAPPEKQIEWARHPRLMMEIKARASKSAAESVSEPQSEHASK
jgi:trimeric autotransporter adhesin